MRSIPILVTPRTVSQHDSLGDPGSLSVVSIGSEDDEAKVDAFAPGEATGALLPLLLVRGRSFVNLLFLCLRDGPGVGGLLPVDLAGDKRFLRK